MKLVLLKTGSDNRETISATFYENIFNVTDSFLFTKIFYDVESFMFLFLLC